MLESLRQVDVPTPDITEAKAPAYLTAHQVGELLQLSSKTVYRLMKDDPTMPALKIGGTVRFPLERLERWLRDREQGRPRKAARNVQEAAR